MNNRPKQLDENQFAVRDCFLTRVSELTGVPAVDIMGRSRERRISTARAMLMWCLVRLAHYSTTEAGLLTGRTHASVIHAVGVLEGIIRYPGGQAERDIVEQLKGGMA